MSLCLLFSFKIDVQGKIEKRRFSLLFGWCRCWWRRGWSTGWRINRRFRERRGQDGFIVTFGQGILDGESLYRFFWLRALLLGFVHEIQLMNHSRINCQNTLLQYLIEFS